MAGRFINSATMSGKWSNVSVFELVRDPWLNVVYVGIYLLIIGAIGMFLTASKKKEN